MTEPHEARWLCRRFRRRVLHAVDARPAAAVMLVPFSTRLPAELLERLRIAAPQLGLRQGEITAAALERFLSDWGC